MAMEDNQKALIGINAGVRDIEGPDKPFFTLRTTYVDAVKAAGGVPIIVPAVDDDAIIAAHVELCDGFIFTGGPDLDPALYGQEVHETVKNQIVHKRRQDYDLALIRKVIEARKPFLAICLGCQEVNVVLGGTLVQDIPSIIKTEIDHAKSYSRHDVEVKAGSLLASIVGDGTCLANTSHHQSVDKIGEGAEVTSLSPTDGIIESFELKEYPFGLALQWHPEVIHDEPRQLAIFQALVKAAAGAGAMAAAVE
jgi:putative glutamine amidotransferase